MRARTVAVGLALLLPGCGGGGSTTSTPVTTPPTTLAACTQSILFQGGGVHPSKILVRVPFSIATAGRLDIIFDWTVAANPFGIYVVSAGTCSIDQFNAGACTFLLRSETTVKPRKVSLASIATGNYEALFANFGTQDDSVSTQVIVSSPTCAPLSSAPANAQVWTAADRGRLRGESRY